ncbi:Spy/CpxP family protein refolding chaperone [Alsobacter sp. SYSU M60028]|uniref:Spy/CpxP family protein refolding chaperone n=1 Tax=Alsobacter ponti TaxID=2962936 RepID=A0ABT1LIL1_9HYPH|nr:Spy/CpxP family protein refolding chaperone [Alsobacter ponti]MCP8940791.1 Spy/CpxP family protein refolding chaperone [Alsobacter ponti]
MALSRNTAIALALAATVSAGGYALAQGRMNDGPMGHDGMMGGRHMAVGPMMMGSRLCEAKESVVPRVSARFESRLKLTDDQKAAFEALKTAMTKAESDLKAACPTDAELADRTPPARLALAEKRMAAGLDALRTVKEPFNALYAKLTDKQRDQLRWMDRGPGWGGGRRG